MSITGQAQDAPAADVLSGQLSGAGASLTSGNAISGLVLSGELSTITGQALDLAPGGITAQAAGSTPALTLAAWEHEARGQLGQWVSGEPAYHGTSAELKPGDLIEPGHPANFDVSTPGHVYFTNEAQYGAAVKNAKHVAGKTGGRPHVYQVEPTGEVERDPDFAVGGGSFRTKHPLRVVGEDDLWKTDPRWSGTGAYGGQVVGLARGYELNARSGMISLDLPPGTITPVPGGVIDFHVTVVYLGPDVDDEALARACERARAAAAEIPGPLLGTVGGIGTFPPSKGSDGKVPVWAGVLLPGAERLRDSLEDLSASEHKKWHPHVTLAYTGPGEALPPPVPATQVVFTHLSVHRGDDEVRRFPLGGRTELAGGTVSGQMAGIPLVERLDLAGRPKASAAS